MQWCRLQKRLLIARAPVADDTTSVRPIISEIIFDTMKELGMSYPTVCKGRLKELQAIREGL